MFAPTEQTPEERAAQDAEAQDSAEKEKRWQRNRTWDGLILQVGERYRNASFQNYEVTHDGQREVVAALAEYASNIEQEILAGHGVVLFGPSGTGKDHLLIALAREAVKADVLSFQWAGGQKLFSEARDLMDSHDSEGWFVRQYIMPRVLILSDPTSVKGTLTDYQAGLLYQIIDGRYRACRATWVTMNVAKGEEAEERLGVAIVDRLRHDSVTHFCKWPSYRKSLMASE